VPQTAFLCPKIAVPSRPSLNPVWTYAAFTICRLIVMNNLFNTKIEIHEKFDLKVSSLRCDRFL
jgi:hypothetical protein